MRGKIVIEFTNGKLAGERFEFTEHDTFLFGRHPKDCHAAIPHDPFASRHHFLLEVNPPDAQLRDLGSLNGTLINGEKTGGRELHESPEQGAKRFHAPVVLRDQDVICVGETEMKVTIESLVKPAAKPPRLPTVVTPPPLDGPGQTVVQSVVICRDCGENVTDEAGKAAEADYVCLSCRQRVASDPMQHLKDLIQAAVQNKEEDTAPRVDGYETIKKLGEGGMGIVYQARNLRTGEMAAVKTMHSKIAVDEGSRSAFLRECEVLSKLQHDNIVRLIESGSSGSVFYFVMDFCNGGTLQDYVGQQRRFSLKKMSQAILHALSGLAYAHENGFVHRDIKPQNILLHREAGTARAKIGDFGLAKNFEKAGFSGMTATGSVAGTYHFMPREQLTDFKRTRPVSDIWSLGATFYYLLTGRFPRDFDPDRHPVDIILEGRIIPIRQRDRSVPESIAAVIDRSVVDDPDKRLSSAEEMRATLSRALKSLPGQ